MVPMVGPFRGQCSFYLLSTYLPTINIYCSVCLKQKYSHALKVKDLLVESFVASLNVCMQLICTRFSTGTLQHLQVIRKLENCLGICIVA